MHSMTLSDGVALVCAIRYVRDGQCPREFVQLEHDHELQ